MPVTSTLALGQTYRIVNNSTGVVTVQSSGANTIQAMASGTELLLTCILTSGTTAASWSSKYNSNSGVISFANVGSSPNAQGASVSGSTITLQPASATEPGIISTGTQSYAGNKTFTGSMTFSSSAGSFIVEIPDTEFNGTLGNPGALTCNQYYPATFEGGITTSGFVANTGFEFLQYLDGTLTGSNAQVSTTDTNDGVTLTFTNGSLSSIATIPGGYYLILQNSTGNSITLVNNYGGSVTSGNNIILTGYGSNLLLPNNTFAVVQFDFNAQVYNVIGGNYPIPYLDTQPVTSATATSAWATSLTAGTAKQNTSGYGMIVNVAVTVSSATSATIIAGVGTTSTPTTQTIVPTFTVATSTVYTFSTYVPNNSYLLVNSTGTITISSITTSATGI
jgi:hypothetical protein